jgi:hypothetical protein
LSIRRPIHASSLPPCRRRQHYRYGVCRHEPRRGRVPSDPLAGFRLLPDLGREHPTNPWPPNYIVIIGSEVPTFGDALVFKDGLLRNGTCSF